MRAFEVSGLEKEALGTASRAANDVRVLREKKRSEAATETGGGGGGGNRDKSVQERARRTCEWSQAHTRQQARRETLSALLVALARSIGKTWRGCRAGEAG